MVHSLLGWEYWAKVFSLAGVEYGWGCWFAWMVEQIQRKQIGLLGWVEMGYPNALQ